MKRDANTIYKLLRDRVIGGEYEPGTHLREEPIAHECGLSRTPVRAALKRLVEEGLATSNAGQGIRVAAWNALDIEEVFELRMLLEPHAAKLTAKRRGDNVLDRLRASNEQIATLINLKNLEAITEIEEANRNFHRIILDNSGSPRLRAMLNTIIEMPKITRLFDLYTRSELEQSLRHHQDLTLAIESRDGDLAFQIMQVHLKISYLRYVRHRNEDEK